MSGKNIKLDQLSAEIEKDLTALFKGIADESQSRIIDGAPVSTGALRASIRAGVNTQVVEYSANVQDPDGTATKSNNASVISGANLGDTVNITVGAPYAADVEGGSSENAPTGFVRVVGEGLDAIVETVDKNLGKYR
jgi:hypothetical protein